VTPVLPDVCRDTIDAYEVSEAYEALIGDAVLGLIECFDVKNPQAGEYCWSATSCGTRSWWYSKAGAIARVIEASAITVACELLKEGR
jgi:hypothetical protein